MTNFPNPFAPKPKGEATEPKPLKKRPFKDNDQKTDEALARLEAFRRKTVGRSLTEREQQQERSLIRAYRRCVESAC